MDPNSNSAQPNNPSPLNPAPPVEPLTPASTTITSEPVPVAAPANPAPDLGPTNFSAPNFPPVSPPTSFPADQPNFPPAAPTPPSFTAPQPTFPTAPPVDLGGGISTSSTEPTSSFSSPLSSGEPTLNIGSTNPVNMAAGSFTNPPASSPSFSPLSSPEAAPISMPEPAAPVSAMPQTSPIDNNPTAFPGTPEAAPTDLSHLVETLTSGQGQNPPQPPTTGPDVMAAAAAVAPGAPTVTTTAAGGLPKWALIAVAVVLLLVVTGGSAYFILGIGKSSPTTSLPAEQAPLTNPPQSLLPVNPTPVVEENAVLEVTPSPQISAPVGTSSAQTNSSALERLRQRQTE